MINLDEVIKKLKKDRSDISYERSLETDLGMRYYLKGQLKLIDIYISYFQSLQTTSPCEEECEKQKDAIEEEKPKSCAGIPISTWKEIKQQITYINEQLVKDLSEQVMVRDRLHGAMQALNWALYIDNQKNYPEWASPLTAFMPSALKDKEDQVGVQKEVEDEPVKIKSCIHGNNFDYANPCLLCREMMEACDE